MSDAEWEDAYRAAWQAYYTPDHVRSILRRAAANRLGRPSTTLSTILWFYLMVAFEGVHPLEGRPPLARLSFPPRPLPPASPRFSPPLLRYLVHMVGIGWGFWWVCPPQGAFGVPGRYSDLAIAHGRARRSLDSLDLFKATRGAATAGCQEAHTAQTEPARACTQNDRARIAPYRAFTMSKLTNWHVPLSANRGQAPSLFFAQAEASTSHQ